LRQKRDLDLHALQAWQGLPLILADGAAFTVAGLAFVCRLAALRLAVSYNPSSLAQLDIIHADIGHGLFRGLPPTFFLPVAERSNCARSNWPLGGPFREYDL